MTKKSYILLLAGVLVFFLLPYLAVTFAPEDAGMALCFILFFSINPAYSIAAGIASAKNMRKMWYIPLLPAILFILSSWVLFSPTEISFLIYSLAYLFICAASMLITHFLTK